MKKQIFVSLVLVIVVLGISLPLEKAMAQKLELTWGTTSSTSSYYASALIWAKVVNDNVPSVNITIAESGATYDNINRTRAGEFNLSMPCAYSGLLEAYYGLNRYKGKPYPELRMLGVSNPLAIYYLVREDSGVKDVKDLDGKGFFSGPIGHISSIATEKVFTSRGIKPKYFVGGFGDAVTAMLDNRIVGFSKAGAGMQLDASMIQVASVNKTRILSWTPDMVDEVVNLIPGAVRVTVPKGVIQSMPGVGPVTTWGQLISFFTTVNLSEDTCYAIVKAIHEHWDSDIAPNFKPCADVDFLKDSIKLLSDPERAVPLHAGAIRYFREKGIDVPAKLIPPEAK